MTCNADTKAIVCARLAARIDTLGRELSHLSPSRIAFAVDDIRREARVAQLEALAVLASGLERAMATSGGNAVVMPYLDAMGDVLEAYGVRYGKSEPLPAAAQAALLASVGLRLHG
jgi:hypothetical protein